MYRRKAKNPRENRKLQTVSMISKLDSRGFQTSYKKKSHEKFSFI